MVRFPWPLQLGTHLPVVLAGVIGDHLAEKHQGRQQEVHDHLPRCSPISTAQDIETKGRLLVSLVRIRELFHRRDGVHAVEQAGSPADPARKVAVGRARRIPCRCIVGAAAARRFERVLPSDQGEGVSSDVLGSGSGSGECKGHIESADANAGRPEPQHQDRDSGVSRRNSLLLLAAHHDLPTRRFVSLKLWCTNAKGGAVGHRHDETDAERDHTDCQGPRKLILAVVRAEVVANRPRGPHLEKARHHENGNILIQSSCHSC